MRVFAIVAGAAALVCNGAATAQTLGIGTAPQGSIGYNMGSAIAKVIAETEKLQSRVQPYSGSSAILPLVNSGELDITVCNVLEAQEAANGEGPYNGRRQPNVRVLAVIFPIYSSIFVKKDSPIQTIAELKGKRLPYGYTAQLTLNRVVDAILATGGLTGKDIVPVLVPNVIRGVDDFAEGKADGGFFALGAGKVSEIDKTVGGIRYLPVSDDPAAVAAMQKIMQYAYVTTVNPSPAFAGLAGPDEADGVRLPRRRRQPRQGRRRLPHRQGDVREQAEARRKPPRVRRVQPGRHVQEHAGAVPPGVGEVLQREGSEAVKNG